MLDWGVIQSHEEGMINITMSKLLDVSDCSLSGSLWFKLVGYVNEIIQGCEYLGVLGVGALNIYVCANQGQYEVREVPTDSAYATSGAKR